MAHSPRSGPAEPCWTSSLQHVASRIPSLVFDSENSPTVMEHRSLHNPPAAG